MPGLEQAAVAIGSELFGGLSRYFEDCIEPGGLLRAVLENDCRFW